MLEKLENMEMPKSKNSSIAVNQQGKHLSYIVGVYFGDGCVYKVADSSKKIFRLEVIDEDFRNYTAECFEYAFTDKTITRFHNMKNGTKYYGIQIYGIGDYIESITGMRRLIPNFVYKSDENIKSFIEGLLDSEGWIQLQSGKSGNVFRGHIGFAITSEVIHELTKLLSRIGVKYGKIGTYTKNRKKALKNISINIPTFIDAGLCFHVWRKQERVEKFKLIRKIIGTTKKERCSFREQNPDLIERMVCSDLYSDVKRFAEMTNPATV